MCVNHELYIQSFSYSFSYSFIHSLGVNNVHVEIEICGCVVDKIAQDVGSA